MSDVKVTGTAGAAGSAGQNARATNYGADPTNSAEAYGGAGGSGGGNGGAASAGVSAAASGSGTATATASSFGGAGGNSGVSGAGGAGGVASNTTATASGFNAYATTNQTGGAGGSGYSGGTGADSTLTNAVSGTTTGGRLRLHQVATGGAGGQATSVNPAGQGGAGTSNLTFADTTASGVYGTSTAAGGAGGANTGAGSGGLGATGTASISLTGTGNFNYGRATATGGVGGDSSATGTSYSGGAGGAATSSANVRSTSAASNYSETIAYAGSTGGAGGAGVSHGGAGAAGSSTATVSGTTSYSKATVHQTGGAGGGATGATGIGGAGASSTLTNAVSGSSTGGLGLNQYAYGGAGGSGYTGGAAGNGTSSLTINSTNGGKLIGRSFAGGGAGGSGVATGAAGGAATAHVVMSGQNYVYSDAFASGGYGGTGSGPNGRGGVGGSATGSASATTSSTSLEAYAYVRAFGGNSGNSNASNVRGPNGGVASGSTATATGFNARANVIQRGGNGGNSYGAGGAGGYGASSTLANAASGTTTGGTLYLEQQSIGGAGGSGAGNGGGGGSASSTLTFSDTTASSLTGYVKANGGSGGNGGSLGGFGGAGTATLALTGVNAVESTAFAKGGDGAHGGSKGGLAGSATSNAAATSTGLGAGATATALATAGAGAAGTGGSLAGGTNTSAATASATTAAGQLALADAVSNGDPSLGSAQTTATTHTTGPVTTVSAIANAPVGDASIESRADSGTIPFFGSSPSSTPNAEAFATATPESDYVSSAMQRNSLIQQDFNGGPVIGAGVLGAKAPSGSENDYHSEVDWTVNTTTLGGDLLVGLPGTSLGDTGTFGTGFDSLTFTVTVGGATAVNQNFTSLAAAQAYFSNNVIDLGAVPNSTALAVDVKFDEEISTSGSGYATDFILGSTAQATPPVVGSTGNTVVWSAGGPPVTVDSNLTVSSSGSAVLTGATVTISSGFLAGDALYFNNQNGITGSFSGNTLTLSGTASLANYQAALESVTYSSINGNPANSGADTQRTISWQVMNGASVSSAGTSTINISVDSDTNIVPSVVVDGGGSPVINAAGAQTVSFTVGGLDDETGTATFTDSAQHSVAAVVSGNGSFSVNLSSLNDGTITSSLVLSDPTGNKFQAAGNAVTLDTDKGTAPTLVIGGGGSPVITAATAQAVSFTVGGLEDETGTATFSDGINTVTAAVSGNGTFSVNLASLKDGSVSSSLAVSDQAGNSFQAAGNGITLDTDKGVTPTLVVDGGGNPVINAAASRSISFTVSGLEDETGTATFSDGVNSVTAAVSGNGSFSVDLSSLNDGPISSSLVVKDPAGNSFQALGNAATLDTDRGEVPVLTVTGGQPVIGIVADHAVTFTVSGLDDETGTAVFSDADNHSVTAAVQGDGTFTVDLSSLDPTTVVSTMLVSDPARNSFSATGNSFTIDAGPADGPGSATVGHNKTADLTSLIMGLIRPGISGDTETLVSVSAAKGIASLNNGVVTYTAPASGPDTISFMVKDQYGDTLNGVVNVTVDPGPAAGTGSATVGHNQTVDLTSLIKGLVTPGIAGDSETVSSVSAASGTATLSNGIVTYTAPSAGSDILSYTVVDQYGDTAAGALNLTVDPGPTAGGASITVAAGATTDLTSYLLGLDTPGIAGDKLTLTGDNTAGTRGSVTLAAGDLTYTAPASGTDSFGYTVSDQYGDTASAVVKVTTGSVGNIGNGSGTVVVGSNSTNVGFGQGVVTVVAGNGNDTITGGNAGDTVVAGNGNDTVTLGQGNNTITLGSGNDKVTVGNGSSTITITGSPTATDTIKAGNGNNALILGAGTYNITLGNGNNELVLGSGTYNVTDGTGTNLFVLSSPQSVLDVLFTSKDELVFKNSGFDLGADNGLGTWPPQPIASSLFSSKTNGTFASPANRFAYNSATGQLFYDAQGNTPGSTSFEIADLTNRPHLSAGNLLFTS